MRTMLIIMTTFMLAQTSFAEDAAKAPADQKMATPAADSAVAPAADATAAPAATNAGNNRSESYSCTSNGLTRTINVVSDGAEKLPCKVKYAKPDEGEAEPQFLWSANNDLEYCIDKAAFLADKLTGWGWSCTGN